MRSREAWPESDESRYDVAGRGVIVTGAAAGIGRANACAIAPAAYRDPPVARSDVPLGRAATARTVGEAALFLASEAAAATTGHVLPVDGGLLAQLRPGADSSAFEKGRS